MESSEYLTLMCWCEVPTGVTRYHLPYQERNMPDNLPKAAPVQNVLKKRQIADLLVFAIFQNSCWVKSQVVLSFLLRFRPRIFSKYMQNVCMIHMLI